MEYIFIYVYKSIKWLLGVDGYHACLTHRRSPVRVWQKSYFSFLVLFCVMSHKRCCAIFATQWYPFWYLVLCMSYASFYDLWFMNLSFIIYFILHIYLSKQCSTNDHKWFFLDCVYKVCPFNVVTSIVIDMASTVFFCRHI